MEQEHQKSLLIGIDIGTTHIKACLTDETGRAAAFYETEQEMKETEGFGRCMSCESLVEKVTLCLQAILEHADRSRVQAIGITGMAEAGVPIGREGSPLGPVIPWNSTTCPIAQDFPEEMKGLPLYEKTGLLYHPKYSINRILWYRENRPDLFREMDCFLSVPDYIAFWLTGEKVTEESLACRTMLYHYKEQKWDDWLLNYSGMEGRLPRIVRPGEALPKLTKEKAELFGLFNTVSVKVSGHDHLCAAYTEDIKEGELFNSMGTAEVFIGFQNKLPEDQLCYEAGIQKGRFAGREYFICNLPSSGACVEWLRNFLSEADPLSYEELMCCEGKRPSPLHFLPFVNGWGTHRSSAFPGAMIGITSGTERGEVLSAIAEGIACECRVILQRLSEAGITVNQIYATGGGTKNQRLMQAKADLTGREFIICEEAQKTAVGAALIAAGISPVRAENSPVRATSRKNRVCPDPNLKSEYEVKFQEYLQYTSLFSGKPEV